jgi:Small metal-binding protein
MEEIGMKRNTMVAGLLGGSLSLFGAGVGYAAAGTHTAQALEHAEAADKASLLEDIQEHAQVSLTHVKAAEEAKEAGAEHLTAAKTALYDALCAFRSI